jgi:hypothetical protein
MHDAGRLSDRTARAQATGAVQRLVGDLIGWVGDTASPPGAVASPPLRPSSAHQPAGSESFSDLDRRADGQTLPAVLTRSTSHEICPQATSSLTRSKTEYLAHDTGEP